MNTTPISFSVDERPANIRRGQRRCAHQFRSTAAAFLPPTIEPLENRVQCSATIDASHPEFNFVDGDGDQCRVSITRAGTAVAKISLGKLQSGRADIATIDLQGTNKRTRVYVDVLKGGSGSGTTSVQSIRSDGRLAALHMPDVIVDGDVRMAGTVGSFSTAQLANGADVVCSGDVGELDVAQLSKRSVFMAVSFPTKISMGGQTVKRSTISSHFLLMPRISFTSIPAMGSFDNLKGRVANAGSGKYVVAVYIKVGSGWWTKPYWAWPSTDIHKDGRWECDVTTGGIDELANTFAAFVVPANAEIPLAYGGGSIPQSVIQNALSVAYVTR